MSTLLQHKRILLPHIDLSDQTFSFSPVPDRPVPGPLAASIKRNGILHPPIVKEGPTGAYQIVSGRKRLLAARDVLDAAAADCLVLAQDAPAREALRIGLEETLLSRPLSAAETALFFSRLLDFMQKEEAASRFLPLLGHAPHPLRIEKLLDLLALEEPLLTALHDGVLHESVAHELVALPFTDRMVLFEIIELLNLSVSNQKKLVAGCRELAMRTHCTILTLLSDPEAAAILRHPEANPPQKAHNLLAWLSGKRFPRLHEAETDFRRFVGMLRLPKGVTLTHAQSFEKDAVTLSISFADREKLLDSWPGLKDALGKPGCG